MKIRDAIGNELLVDDTVVWAIGGNQVKARVLEVTPPGLITIGKSDKSDGKVVLRLELALQDPGNNKDIALPAFIKTFDPAGERLLATALARGRTV